MEDKQMAQHNRRHGAENSTKLLTKSTAKSQLRNSKTLTSKPKKNLKLTGKNSAAKAHRN